MAYYIDPLVCKTCGTCDFECHVGAIWECDDHFQIDPELCVDCGECADQCPAGAIKPLTDSCQLE